MLVSNLWLQSDDYVDYCHWFSFDYCVGHHMFVSGMNPFFGFSIYFTTLLIAIPSAVKAFNFITTLWKIAI
jgi:heme/copper-type cytochrome/quinol oxidase subunit 1